MDGNVITIGEIVAAVLIYAGFCNRMIAFAQPIRMYCAREGRALLQNSNFIGIERENLIFALSNAYNPWFLRLAVIMLPIAFFTALLGFDPTRGHDRTTDQDLCRKAKELDLKLLGCHFLTSPIVGPIVAVEAVVVIALAALFSRSPEFIRTVLRVLERDALWAGERHSAA